MEFALFHEAHQRGGRDLLGHGAHIEDRRGAHWEMVLQVLRTDSFEENITSGAGNESNDSSDLTSIDEFSQLGRERAGGP